VNVVGVAQTALATQLLGRAAAIGFQGTGFFVGGDRGHRLEANKPLFNLPHFFPAGVARLSFVKELLRFLLVANPVKK
jgi:hypothetical protein